MCADLCRDCVGLLGLIVDLVDFVACFVGSCVMMLFCMLAIATVVRFGTLCNDRRNSH